jgi:hypothetical protein
MMMIMMHLDSILAAGPERLSSGASLPQAQADQGWSYRKPDQGGALRMHGSMPLLHMQPLLLIA